MTSAQLRSALPYCVGLALAAALYAAADRIQYTARPGELGPDFWPKLAIGLMAVVCLYEIARTFRPGIGGEARGVAEALDRSDEEEAELPRSPFLLAGGVALTIAYGALIPVLGFVLTTILYLAFFSYLGRYRRHAAVWIASVAGALVVSIVFLKIVYVSLPRGAPPFDRVTDLVVGLW